MLETNGYNAVNNADTFFPSPGVKATSVVFLGFMTVGV